MPSVFWDVGMWRSLLYMDLARCDFGTGTELARDAGQTESFGLVETADILDWFPCRGEEKGCWDTWINTTLQDG